MRKTTWHLCAVSNNHTNNCDYARSPNFSEFNQQTTASAALACAASCYNRLGSKHFPETPRPNDRPSHSPSTLHQRPASGCSVVDSLPAGAQPKSNRCGMILLLPRTDYNSATIDLKITFPLGITIALSYQEPTPALPEKAGTRVDFCQEPANDFHSGDCLLRQNTGAAGPATTDQRSTRCG